jgi:SHS2 domain-containing protein
MYEVFEHTADFGLRARAADLDELFAEAARGLFAVVVEDIESIRAVEETSLELEADGLDDLLHDWLDELLYAFSARHMLFSRFEVQVEPDPPRLRAAAGGERFDPARHRLDIEIKAITYHGLRVEHQAGGWLAEVIIDV